MVSYELTMNVDSLRDQKHILN